MADIRPWFMPWRHAVHEELTWSAALRAGFTVSQSRLLVAGCVDNDWGGGPWGTYRRHFANGAQPSHCLRKREHTGSGADRQALAAAADYIRAATLLAWERYRAGDAARGLFLAGKALHALQDSYFHADRDYSGPAGGPHWGRVTHVRSFLGAHADHDRALDSGRDAAGQPTVRYHEAGRASDGYLRLLRGACATGARPAVEATLSEFLEEYLAQATPLP